MTNTPFNSIGAYNGPRLSADVQPLPKGLRISVDDDDPGYATYCAMREEAINKGLDICIYIDGVRSLDVITADVEGGWVKRFCKDERGMYFLHDGQATTEIVRGEVRVELKAGDQCAGLPVLTAEEPPPAPTYVNPEECKAYITSGGGDSDWVHHGSGGGGTAQESLPPWGCFGSTEPEDDE